MQCIPFPEHKIRHMLFNPPFSGGWACSGHGDFTLLLAKGTHSVLPWYDKDSLITPRLQRNVLQLGWAADLPGAARAATSTSIHPTFSEPKTAAGCHAPFSTH